MAAITLRQLEALVWVVELGTFERAAARLNTTQSTISKRIQELEASTGLDLFDRSQRSARVTEQGEMLLEHARQMLEVQGNILMLKKGGHRLRRRLRLGVTELTAMTWMPRFVTLLRQAYPELMIEPEVDMSRRLYERLIEGRLDLIIVPEVVVDKDIHVVRLAKVHNAWMASPELIGLHDHLPLSAIMNYPIITQGSRSGAGLSFIRWVKAEGAILENTLHADSVMATVALAVAGFGIAYLPKKCFQGLLDDETLVEIFSRPPLPAIPYSLVFRRDLPSAFFDNMADVALQACDFSTPFGGLGGRRQPR